MKGNLFMFFFQSDYVVGAFELDTPWNIAEETMLLDAVEQYGFGNWQVHVYYYYSSSIWWT